MRAVVLCVVVVTAGALLQSQSQTVDRSVRVMSGAASLSAGASDIAALSELRGWDQRITDLSRGGEMTRTANVVDTAVPGRMQERFEQRHRGVRVFGAELTRQVNQFGQAESVFGALYPEITLDVTPTITFDQARARLGLNAPALPHGGEDAELVVLPMTDGTFRLTWTARVTSFATGWAMGAGPIHRRFIDANTGATVLDYNDTWTQTASIGTGAGVLGDMKKMMTGLQNGKYLALDLMRPPDTRTYGAFPKANMITFDLKGNVPYAAAVINAANPTVADIASDDDNTWTDPTLVDAQANGGLTYDFFFKRFGRKGLDNNNLEVWTFANPARPQDYTQYYSNYDEFFTNAFYFGKGNICYGVGLPSNVTVSGKRWLPLSGALDVVAHELTHGVTGYSSKLIYVNESGALNESFSDVMGAAAEFFFQPLGSGFGQADWLLGEDVVRTGGLRSMQDPNAYGMPDHYSVRFTGSTDNGGVHINSSIVNHMYYLSIMGGTNRVSKQTVTGVGFDSRAQIETVIFRAFTVLMPANATFSTARAATLQAARDLYGANSAAERALTAAWSAVGVN